MGNVALEQLVETVAELKRDDPMAPVTIVVPTNVAGRSVGWRLAEGINGRPAVAGLRITTLARMAEAVAAVGMGERRPLLPSVLAAAWRTELEQAAASQADWDFADVWDHPSTVAALVAAYRELREVPERLAFGEDVASVPSETIRLARRVRDRLRPDWYDQQDLYAAATRMIEEHPDAFREFGSLIHYLPGDEPRSASLFAEALTQHFGMCEVDTSESALAHRILHASDADDEIRAVVREVVSELGAGTKAHRLAICVSSQDPYVRTTHALLRGAGVTFNGRGGIPIAEHSCARAFSALLDLPARGFPRAQVFEVLSTWPMRQIGSGDPAPLVAWERISRSANIAGGGTVPDTWSSRLHSFVEQPRNAQQRDAAQQLDAFVTTLATRLDGIDRAATWDEVATLSLELLTALMGELDDIRAWEHDERRAYVTLVQVLRDLRSLDAYRPPKGLTELQDILATELESAIPRVGKFGEGVFVGPIDQARGLDLDRIWVVGLSEDLFPGRPREGALLPEHLRRVTPGLLTARDRVDRLDRALTHAFSTATQVTASFARGDLRASTERLPSRLLLPSLRHLVGLPTLAATGWDRAPSVDTVVECPSHAAGIVGAPAPATEQEWAMRGVLAAPDQLDDPAYHAARRLLAGRRGTAFTRYDGNLSEAEGLPNLADGVSRVAPTTLERFADCPFAYFIQYLLKVKPVEEPVANAAIEPFALGNLFHHAMDRFINAELAADSLPAAGEPWTPVQHERMVEIVRTVIAEARERGDLGHPTLWGFQEATVLRELAALVVEDGRWRGGVGAAPVAAELRFGFTGAEHPAAEFDVADGTMLFVGSADKVDVSADTIYVTDMKTGNPDRFRKIAPKRGTANPTVDGTKLQLPVYAKAALAAYGEDRAVRAQYWFVNGKTAGLRIDVNLDDDLERHFAHVIGTMAQGISRGHFFKKPSKDPGYLYVDCEFCTPGGAGHEATRGAYLRKRRHPDLLPVLDVIDPEAAQQIRADAASEEVRDDA